MTLTICVAKSLQKMLKDWKKHQNDKQPKTRPAIVPHIRRASRNLKSAAQKYGARDGFSSRKNWLARTNGETVLMKTKANSTPRDILLDTENLTKSRS